MQFEILGPAALEIRPAGILQKADYESFVPEAERRIREQGKLSLLVNVGEFDGATPPALWEDLKFDAKHFRDLSRVAVVGPNDSSKQRWLAACSRPFTSAEVRFFPAKDLAAARNWVCGTNESTAKRQPS